MKHILVLILLFLSLGSCKSSKKGSKHKEIPEKQIVAENKKEDTPTTKTKEKDSTPVENKKKHKNQSDEIVDYAMQFKGVRYKWGGTTKSGMDCSGLVFESFRSNDILLPRISRDMAKKGTKIPLNKVNTGDLLFFKTGNKRNSINHVGLIVDIKNNNIEFIHATSSKGVIISNLNETYWLNAFEEARRIL